MSIFDRYVTVDWSGANTPRVGKDSIWICSLAAKGACWTRNPRTRRTAGEMLRDLLARSVGDGERVLVGFRLPLRLSGRVRRCSPWVSKANRGVPSGSCLLRRSSTVRRPMRPTGSRSRTISTVGSQERPLSGAARKGAFLRTCRERGRSPIVPRVRRLGFPSGVSWSSYCAVRVADRIRHGSCWVLVRWVAKR